MHRTFASLQYHNCKLYYSEAGEGEKTLLMFHGYGHTHKNMRQIEETFSSEYKIYSFDLFFHGFSEWNYKDNPLLPQFWKGLLESFLQKHGIGNFSILGFSLGGKVALATLQLFPDRIDHLFLVAPDAIKPNLWYNLATSKPFKNLFKLVVLKPSVFQLLVSSARKLHLIDKSTLRFASTQMNSKEKRRRVYYTWTVYKGLEIETGRIIQLINQYKIKTEIYVGKYDRIIKSDDIHTFAKKLHNVHFIVLNSGHNNLLDELAYYLNKELAKR